MSRFAIQYTKVIVSAITVEDPMIRTRQISGDYADSSSAAEALQHLFNDPDATTVTVRRKDD
jgi:hypothetical protein